MWTWIQLWFFSTSISNSGIYYRKWLISMRGERWEAFSHQSKLLVPYRISNSRSLVGWWCLHHRVIGVDTVLCLGISVLSTYSYHPFISTTIYPKILSNLLNLSCYMELLNLSGFISVQFYQEVCQNWVLTLPLLIVLGSRPLSDSHHFSHYKIA